ncbi:aromatic ring-hydroxylating dioxygenase subunit alpha [Sphingomonas sp. SUN039]|uniref:aromatic ring-hydroxylating dioxygenase subunit alpha n=1 Tax=Sphingomonas sp. SUN039 TaxID=2937787 RepID=UPI002164A968|nr:aromatic ring-hydroxylating dioxygenase subunit alpha [Sphingomonas sp. SUN039]UVO54360.1 aromatic ring-hydroxylating dioxygenase subunit alpha [Sphingomonas sp. SUN039]
MTTYLKDVWYMAAWCEELGDGLLGRRLFDRAIVLFRTADGVAALADRCPHRFAPLSLGTKADEGVICPYHGLTFDAAGQCVRNPFSGKIPPAARVDSWACIERDGIVWLWGGSRETADASLIPDFSVVADGPNVRVVRGYTLLEAPYEFGTDNLMDLSHIEFVHKGSFAGNGVIFAGRHAVRDEGTTLHSDWWMPGVKAPPHTFGIYPPEMDCDHWLDMRWNAPASMHLEIGACPAGALRDGGVIAHQAHILTPASATTTHYFWATTRGHDLESVETDAFLRQLFAQAFDEEDKPIIKAAYENLEGEDFWAAKPLSLGIDAGGTRARRKVEAMLRAEAA